MLLIIFMYVFAILFMQQMKDTMPGEFGTLLTAMKTLFIGGCVLDKVATLAQDVKNQSTYMFFALLFYILLTSFTVMNMLIGVLCEVIAAVSAAQKDQVAIDFVKATIAEVLREIDTNMDGFIEHSEFLQLATNERVRNSLEALNVDVDSFVALSDYLFINPETGANDKQYSHKEFLGMVLAMRSTNTARVMDIVLLRKHVTKCFGDHKGVMLNNRSEDEADIKQIKGAAEEFVEKLTKKFDDAMQSLDHRIAVMQEKGKHA
jgi:hypothetical protein